jgi:hypothetical protein
MPGRKFIAVDLDGTLAYYDTWKGREHIGAPIPAMVQRVKGWLAQGHVVIVFTSRVADPARLDHDKMLATIHAWCEEHVGERLYVTATKQPYFSEIWDNKARRVKANLGIPELGTISVPEPAASVPTQ